MEFNAKKMIEESIGEVINEGKKALNYEPGSGVAHDSSAYDVATNTSILARAGRKAKELADTPLTGKHAAAAATAIAAGLGGVALAKKLRSAKKTAKKTVKAKA